MNQLTRWLALALLAPLTAAAQVYPYFPPPGMSYNATTGQLGLTGPVLFPAISAPAAPGSGTVLAYGAATTATNITALSVKDSFGGSIALGYEQHMIVANQTGGSLAAGNLVYVNGATGGGVPTVALAKADSLTTLPALGFTQYAIPNGGTGEIHLSGSVGAFTIGYSIGQKLYVSDSVAGALTNTAPTAGTSYVEQVGIVTSVGGSGSFQLAVQTPVAVIRAVTGGGTGLGTLTAHGVLLGEGTSNVGSVAALAADTLLLGQGTGADPAGVSLLNCGSSTQALAYSTSTHTFSCQTISGLATPVTVANGGTGLGTLTAHGVLLGEGTSNVASVAALAADTLLLGQGTGADPAAVSLVNCGSSTQALAYSTSTHTFSCQTIATGGGGNKFAYAQINAACTAAVRTPVGINATPNSTGAGNCTIFFNPSNYFAAEPWCTAILTGGNNGIITITGSTGSQITFGISTNGSVTAQGFEVVCIGT